MDAGPVGCWLDVHRYKLFLDIWDNADQLRFVKTSCAIFAGGVLGHCGKPLRKPWRADGTWGITSWVGARLGGTGWVHERDAEPEPGCVFYREYSLRSSGAAGHVGIFVERVGDKWITAEGGGSLRGADANKLREEFRSQPSSVIGRRIKQTNGTVCRLSAPKDVRAKDGLGRVLLGWWRPEDIGVPDITGSTFNPIKRGDRGARVTAWQMRLCANGFDLPRYGVDGDFGAETESVTLALQAARGFAPTGVVDHETWIAAE